MGMAYVGLDVRKKTVSYCVKTQSGRIVDEGVLEARRAVLTEWAGRLRRPWVGAMEATLFAGWVYDHLLPHARELKVAHLLAVDKGGKPFEPRREPAQASERAV